VRRLLPLVALSVAVLAGSAQGGGGQWIGLVTAETEGQVIAVRLPSGSVIRRFHLPADPENVEARSGVRTALVMSTRGQAVTLIDTRTLRIERVLRGFSAPHIAAITPTGRYAYVTDDGSGKLSVIDLRRRRVVRRVFVGLGAHHLTVSPDGRRTWVALGEDAHRIVVLNSSHVRHPRVFGRLVPRGEAHDLAFTSSGARVWVTHSNSSRVDVYDARTRRLLKAFSGGAAPQHVAFWAKRGYVTSGYGGTMQIRRARTARLLRTVRTAYGSFNIGIGGGTVATSSLLRGTLTFLDGDGTRLGQRHLAQATRDVAVFFP
jgi:YVTN family beta-propeller protein